jgi:O-antigen/teichoic acid export membrane protein
MKKEISFIFILLGVINIVVQVLLPDLVPGYINGLITSYQQSSWNSFLMGLLVVWYFGGIISFFGGILVYVYSGDQFK